MSFEIGDSLFASKLHAMIEQRKADLVANVASASGVSDFAAYQRLVGHITGLGEVLQMFETVAGRISEEGRRK